MSRGHNFTRCRFCNKEYVCGDCITSDCELGNTRRSSCKGYQDYVRQEKSLAGQMEQIAKTSDGKKRAIAILLGDEHWGNFAESLTDAQLAEELKIKVWANQELGTYEIALVTEAIERLSANQKARQ